METLQEYQTQSGAIFNQNGIPLSFGNDVIALKAARTDVALSDRSHWGLLQLKGEDRLRFLHNQTTNNINGLQPGQGDYTVFVTSTGRTIDLATVYLTPDAILILVSPNRRQYLMEWMDRYIFPFDKVELADISDNYAIFTLLGSQSSILLKNIGISDSILEQSEFTHTFIQIGDTTIHLAVGTGLDIAGYTLIVPVQSAVKIWETLIQTGAIPAGENVWEQLRIEQGRPLPERELTEEYNPLEAGLWKAISFDKGCYIGQETIARLNTYQGVKQRLWGIKLNQLVEPNTPITLEDNKVGLVTSVVDTERGAIGLAYVRTKAGGEGLSVNVGEASGQLYAVPFLTHEYYS